MCGIAGILRFDGEPVAAADLWRMNQLLAHRGPDGDGAHIDRTLGLAHTRLSILDLTEAGRQPMNYADGRYWISYNGEVYNFVEIRRDLEARGHTFRSDTDTEVVLAAFSEWGSDALDRFNGMWAFAIWDSAERRLLLSRDRFGIKPLYYYADDRMLAFASEIKAFLGIDAIDLDFDVNGLATSFALTTTMDGMEMTAFSKVRRLLPGHYLTATEGDRTPRVTRWWRTLDHLPEVTPLPKRQDEQLAELLFDACRLRMRSDVPVGTCLSGGLDSSSIFGVVNRISGETDARISKARSGYTAFIARFPDRDNREQQLAQDFADHVGAPTRHLDVKPEDAIGILGSIIYDFEETGLLYPAQWMLYRELRRAGTLVSLDGHGADECLAGYTTNATHRALELTNRLIGVAGTINDAKANPQAWADMVRKGTMPDIARQTPVPNFEPRSLNYVAFDHRMLRGTPVPHAEPIWNADAELIRTMGLSFQLLYSQGHGGFMQWILRTYDMASMAHGVEVRTPFLDWRLFCYCLALPASAKIGEGYTKLALRRAMRGVVPDATLDNKRKIGFPSPTLGWLDGPLQPIVDETVHSLTFLTSPLWDGQALSAAIATKDPSHKRMGYRAVWPYVQTFLLADRLKSTRRKLFDQPVDRQVSLTT